jgi:SecD/SecF fusion protein
MFPLSWQVIWLLVLVVYAAAMVPVWYYLKAFRTRILICTLPLVLGGIFVGNAVDRYLTDGGGFKLGVDLVGGTILIYQVDGDKMTEDQKKNFKVDELAARLKHRLDPNDLYNVTIRPLPAQKVEDTRIEIILPTGGAHQEEIERRDWRKLLDEVTATWPNLKEVNLTRVPLGDRQQLAETIQANAKNVFPDGAEKSVSRDEADKFVNEHYKVGTAKKDVTSEQVQAIKNLIRQVGALEFRILANSEDDKEAIEAAKLYFEDSTNQTEANNRAKVGQPPPFPPRTFEVKLANKDTARYTYSWVELGKQERFSYGLNNDAGDPWRNLLTHVRYRWGLRDLDEIAKNDEAALRDKIIQQTGATDQEIEDVFRESRKSTLWEEAKKNRGKAIPMGNNLLLYSRECVNEKISLDERKKKEFEYFVLTRDPEEETVPGSDKKIVKKITGDSLSANVGPDAKNNPSVHFRFDTAGGNLFYDITSKNIPTGGSDAGKFKRHLAIILDGMIISAPTINAAIRTDGVIEGRFTEQEVNTLVGLLRSGALPATLKPLPVSENTMGATLGADTIYKGTLSVGMAFAAILLFMLVYYRFAGMVACIALLANLLLTVAFMVIVNATFTLPGLAGLVLMLGMAVDANVLIYERLREERDRGASLALAIRNGYDRAFPIIIDTHLSSIFTAIVLYTVGNDQLKGFGISLTVGLIISLFTSLYMTRLMFDLWLAKNWLHKLSMFRLLSRPNIDFMRIRYYWFTATILLTIFGASVFIYRLPQDLNIDFNGGTAYGGQTKEPLPIGTLRAKLDNPESWTKYLNVVNVKEIKEGQVGTDSASATQELAYDITYRNPDNSETHRIIHFPNRPEGATEQEREADVKNRAQQLPDVSVEQIFPSIQTTKKNRGFFNVRTSEKAPELVQASISRLLGEEASESPTKGDQLVKTSLSYDIKDDTGKVAILSFFDPDDESPAFASPSQVEMLLKRVCRLHGVSSDLNVNKAADAEEENGQFTKMQVVWTEGGVGKEKISDVLKALQQEFKERPLPDRLETFDRQLAEETQTIAMYAILASWAATLLYLWFRFGSWTFGLATVLCLIHDLFFTLGIIAFCHFIHGWFPGLASALLLEDFKIDLPAVAALLTLVGYSVNDTIVVFDRIREVRGKNPDLTLQMLNDSVNQTLSRTLLTSFSVWLVVIVLYIFGGEGVHLFAFVMVVGVIVGTYSSIYIASPLLLIFGEGKRPKAQVRERQPQPVGVTS